MSKRSSKKSKRRSKALPALGFAGVSLSMAGGACASTSEAIANTSPTSQSQNHELFLGEEEIFDTSLSPFYTFDRENGGQTSLAQRLKLARGGGCGCGHGGGCGCGHGGGCGCGHGGGCGGCGCGGWGVCIWPWPLGWCWGESTPPAKVASVASEPVAQIGEAEE